MCDDCQIIYSTGAYIDFERCPQAVGDVIPPIQYGYPNKKSSGPSDIYTPYPFNTCQLCTNETYIQVVRLLYKHYHF